MTWWQSLSTLQQVIWVLALLSTTFFTVSTLLSSVGMGDADIDLDMDADLELGMTDVDNEVGHQASEALEYLSVRNILAFTLGFSWTGILFYGQMGIAALLPAVPVGGVFAFLNNWLTNSMKKLESSGNANLREAIGQEARVSVEVNENMEGQGKVVVQVRDREMELWAITEDTTPLKRGDRVQVYNVEDDILWVSRDDRLGLETL